MWTDLTRAKNLNKSTKWTNPPRVKTIVHNVDGPDKGKNLNDPKVDRPSVKTHVHDMDGPNKVQKLKQIHEVDGPHEGSKP